MIGVIKSLHICMIPYRLISSTDDKPTKPVKSRIESPSSASTDSTH